MDLKPFGVMLGLLGNLMIVLALHELIASTDCGVGCEPPGAYVAMVPLGILVSVAAVFLGGSFLTFLGLFLSVGIGSLWAGVDLPAGSEQRTFAFVFGGIFAAVPLLITLLSLVGTRKATATAHGEDLDPTRLRALFDEATERDTPVEALEKLAALHASGALTDAEFAAAKARVLS